MSPQSKSWIRELDASDREMGAEFHGEYDQPMT